MAVVLAISCEFGHEHASHLRTVYRSARPGWTGMSETATRQANGERPDLASGRAGVRRSGVRLTARPLLPCRAEVPMIRA